jgi:hypothetical protein
MRSKQRVLSVLITAMLIFAGSLFINTDDAIAVGVCNITVENFALPDLGTEFQFSAPSPGPGNFALSTGEQEIFNQILFGDEVTITEQVPEGWILESFSCEVTGGNFAPLINELENGVTIDCEGDGPPGQDPEVSDITCLFVNSIIPRNIPTLSEWGIIAMAGILGMVGFMAIRRTKLTV